jgi:hypothetical protein
MTLMDNLLIKFWSTIGLPVAYVADHLPRGLDVLFMFGLCPLVTALVILYAGYRLELRKAGSK